jgi:N-acetylmuramoyl-L-alanine amidase
VCHATDNYGDTAEGERSYESRTWGNAFTHFFVDDVSIIQVADINYLCWGCGSVGNQRYVQIELCQTYDNAKFQNAYARYVWLIAKILFDKKLGVTDGKTLVSHKWVTDNLGGTTHQDPIQYLESHGVSWSQHVTNVMEEYSKMVAAAVPQNKQASPSFLVKVLATSLYYYNKPDWNAKAGIVHANEVFTVVETLTVNGSKMYRLKSGNYLTANPSYVKVM